MKVTGSPTFASIRSPFGVTSSPLMVTSTAGPAKDVGASDVGPGLAVVVGLVLTVVVGEPQEHGPVLAEEAAVDRGEVHVQERLGPIDVGFAVADDDVGVVDGLAVDAGGASEELSPDSPPPHAVAAKTSATATQPASVFFN